jgi:SH3-like domain-containing protein
MGLRFFSTLSLASLVIPNFVFALCVSDSHAKLRRGPGRTWPVTWEVEQYMPLKKLGKKKGWYRVEDVDGQKHWIREDLTTSAFKCATIKDTFANLRKGPGKNFEAVSASPGDKYLSFRLMGEQNGWLKLEDRDGDEVWVLQTLAWVQ